MCSDMFLTLGWYNTQLVSFDMLGVVALLKLRKNAYS